jgi:NAD(P)-dependent dehydrogenase (short-subunit alcohol dehydrogenase family)
MLEESIQRIVEKTGRSAEEARTGLAASNPQGRIIQPKEVADAVLYLCGESAISVNGHALAISGGATW